MGKFVRKNVDTTIESNLVTASITSTHFLEQIYPMYSPQYMRNVYAKTLMKWSLDYFEEFGEAPKQHIQSIFDIEKGKMDDAETEIIQTFLKTLSKNYVDDQGINDDYVISQTMPYFRKREIEIRVENAQKLIDVGKIDAAEEELFHMKKIVLQTSNWSNPFEQEKIYEVFDESQKGVFRFPGALGDMFGDLERGWLIAFLAPFKRGKTWLLQEAVVIGAILGLKCVFVSLEMKHKNINERLYKRISAYGDEGKTDHAVPVFDCRKNQIDVCTKALRTNFTGLYDGEGDLPEFTADLDYRPCCVCKDKKGEQEDYVLATWFETMVKPEFTLKNVSKKMRSFSKFYGDNIRVICYPRFSASVSDLERDLDILEQTDGFVPDIIAADYADIFKPEGRGNGSELRSGIDEIWKNLAAMAARRSALTFSASQGNRGSLYKENLDQSDLAEWIGKLAHVDKFASVNQSLDEKRRGIIRIGMLADRHKEFHEKDQTMLLQALSLGQVHLDSSQMKGR